MSIALLIYLADVAEVLSGFARSFTALATLIIIGSGIALASSDATASVKKLFFCAILIGSLCCLVTIVVPKKETIYLMAAATVGEKILEQPGTKALGDKVYQILNTKLDEMLGDASKDAK